MARKWINKNLPGALHFVTGNVLNREPIFKYEIYCRAFFEALQILRTDHETKIIAFVLMLDHFHLIANPKDGDIQNAMLILKSLAAKSIVAKAPHGRFAVGNANQVWQESFKSLPLWSGWMITQKINYVHANPVRADLCDTAEDYSWTSFRSFYREETDPLLAIDSNWWWADDQQKFEVAAREWETERSERLRNSIEEKKRRLRFPQ